MVRTRVITKLSNIHWKRKSNIALFSIIVFGFVFTLLSFSHNYFYDILFSVCLGLFIGGIIMSILSTILAEISTHDLQNIDHIDHIDLGHIDHVDHIDHTDLGHFDHVDHIDHTDLGHFDHVDHMDHADHIDHIDLGHFDHVDQIDHADQVDHIDHFDDTTPAPFMLLFSTSLLFFGIAGVLFYYLFAIEVKFLIFFSTLAVTYLFNKVISITWKKIAKSRFYNISSTQNLIGQKGVIVLDVDWRGGVIKIHSDNPMKFEKIHVKPVKSDSSFKKGEEVYICDIKDGFLLVDNKVSSIQYRMR